MVNPIPLGVRKFWEDWKIRGPVLVSLFIQIVLVLVAPFRKRTSHKLVILIIWSCYLLADAITLSSFSQISSIKQDISGSKCSVTEDGFSDLAVLWSAFLWVHLGGPDSITAFAIADTQLWIRLLLSLVIRAVATIYLILLTLPCNTVIVPTILLFIAGIIKCRERCLSLYLANDHVISQIESVLSLSEDFFCKIIQDDPLSLKLILDRENYHLNELGIMKEAYAFLKLFRGRLDLHFWPRNLKPESTLRVGEVVMNFLYDIIFSKALVVQRRWGYVLRFLTLSSIVAAFCIFRFEVHNKVQQGYYNGTDVEVTYVLLRGAIILELYSIVMIFFSDWTLVKVDLKKFGLCFLPCIFCRLVNLKKMDWDDNHHSMSTGILFRRWSGCVSCHSVAGYYFKNKPHHDQMTKSPIHAIGKVIMKPFGTAFCWLGDKLFKEAYDEMKYVSHEPLSKELWEFIFVEIHKKLLQEKPHDFSIHSLGGELALKDIFPNSDIRMVFDNSSYESSLVIWHIATEMLYYYKRDDDDDDEESADEEIKEHDNEKIEEKEYSKILSDYMLYLLVIRRSMRTLSKQFDRIFYETCRDLRELFSLHGDKIAAYNEAFHIYQSQMDIDRMDKKKWVYRAGVLAAHLTKRTRNRKERWRVVGSVWVEKLLLGAIQCSVASHAEQLCRGGELLTLVWFLFVRLLAPDLIVC